MKEVNVQTVRERIAHLEKQQRVFGLTLQSEFELACLRKLLTSLESVPSASDDELRAQGVDIMKAKTLQSMERTRANGSFDNQTWSIAEQCLLGLIDGCEVVAKELRTGTLPERFRLNPDDLDAKRIAFITSLADEGKEMSELHYGKNVEWLLRELSAHEASDIESAEIEVIGENDQGVEGFTAIDITILAADAVSMISALQQKLDSVLAENVALKGYVESECYIVDDNSGPMADADVCATERMPLTPATDAILNQVRAEGVDMFAKTCSENSKKAASSDLRNSWWVSGEHADDFANQLRTGSTDGGV